MGGQFLSLREAYIPNLSLLVCLEAFEKFVVVVGWGGVGWVVEHVTTVSNSNASCFRVELS